MLKVEAGHLSLEILKPAQMAPTHNKEAAYQMTEEEDVQSWDSSLDEDFSKEDSRAQNISVSPAQENNDAYFIFILQATEDKNKYTTAMII